MKNTAFEIIMFVLLPVGLFSQEPDATYFKQRVTDQVIYYNGEMDRLEKELKMARENRSPDTATLDKSIDEAMAKCFQVPQNFIRDYPASPLCFQALKMLGDGSSAKAPVQLGDLEKLFTGLSGELKGSAAGKDYAERLKSYAWFGKLKKAGGSAESINYAEVSKSLTSAVGLPGAKVGLRKAGTQKLDAKQLTEKVKAGTLILNMAYREGQRLKVNPASAYAIDAGGIVVTNYHVVKEYSSKDSYTSLSAMTADGVSYPVVEILTASESDDLAVIQLDLKGDRLPALALGGPAQPGDKVSVMGHPMRSGADGSTVQYFHTLTEGVATGMRQTELFGKPCVVMGITADFTLGSSGGPVVDECGNVVGTVSRLSGGEKLVVPVSELRKLIETQNHI